MNEGTVGSTVRSLLIAAGGHLAEDGGQAGWDRWHVPTRDGEATVWVLCSTDNIGVVECAGWPCNPACGAPAFREHARGGALGVTCQQEGSTRGLLITKCGLQRAAIRLRRDPTSLMRALRELGERPADPELMAMLQGISHERPGAEVAPAYYGARALEVLALVADADARGRTQRLSELDEDDQAALARVRTCIVENLDRAVASEELCRVANLSPGRLTRLFRHAEGETPQEYARRARMAQARSLLETSSLPMADVSRQLGFSRQGSFSEAFKARYGLTPHEYRTLCHSPTLV